MPYSSAERTALLALQGGALRLERGRWLIADEGHAQEIPHGIVRWLLGERLIEAALPGRGGPSYHLTAKGEREAAAVHEEYLGMSLAWSRVSALETGPLLLVRPAPQSEDLDHMLALRVDTHSVARHRERLAHVQTAWRADPAGFEFVQYSAEVFALPIDNALLRSGLLPAEDRPFLAHPFGLEEPEAMGARWCPDRGVNYGADYVQWFGGFGAEDPLIISPKLDLDAFQTLLSEFERMT